MGIYSCIKGVGAKESEDDTYDNTNNREHLICRVILSY